MRRSTVRMSAFTADPTIRRRGQEGQLWVKTGKARCEHMFSALPLEADVAQRGRHVRLVLPPWTDSVVRPWTRSQALTSYGLAGATCGATNGSVRCTMPSVYSPSISAAERPSIVERMSVVSSPIDGAPRQMRPGVSDIFGTTPKTRIGTPD